MEFSGISTGAPFKGKIPTVVDVVETVEIDSVLMSVAHQVEKGDAEWDDALVWWMYVNGYMPESELDEQPETE